jgi:multidrug efflux pump subunit AcrA (membrane-fusion protein)
MASVAAKSSKKARSGRRTGLIIGGIILVGLIAALVVALRPRTADPGALPAGWLAVPVTSGSIAASVGATGNVEPQAEASLRFASSGTVAEILVRPGERVAEGAPLARIDTGSLELRVEQAQADLLQAQADLEGLLAGASEAELAEARARLEQARRQFSQAAGSVTPANIAAARAELTSAQARLTRLEAGPANADVASADERVQSAQVNLENARTSLSAAKERALNDLETRANALRNAQDEYSRVYWENRELEDLPGDLPRERIDQEAAALRTVADAETALRNAQTAYDQAQSDEVNTLQAREAELASAQAARERVLRGAEPEDVASARASVQRAQASLDQLIGAQRQSELATQQSSVEIAQANLDSLLADPSASTITAREAAVVRAEVALRSAHRDLELGTLRAPFAATIAQVNMRVGEPADATASIDVVDLASYHVDLPIDELDIAQVQLGQRAMVDVDALPGVSLGGAVSAIAPHATRSDSGTTTYEVTVTLDEDSPGVRSGMTAVVSIITEEKQDVVLAPRRAVRAEGGQSFVLVPSDAPVAADATPGERRPVELGLSNAEFVEIVSGLEVGEQVLVQDVVSTFNPSGPPR